uniref:Uncharacterized protein n=1 Tax=Triticum urartu TaxID=4572 RepID=A0A8R7UZL4_TRIUA
MAMNLVLFISRIEVIHTKAHLQNPLLVTHCSLSFHRLLAGTGSVVSIAEARDTFLEGDNELLQELLLRRRHHVEEAPVFLDQPPLLEELHHEMPGHEPPLEAVHEQHRPARDVLRLQPDLLDQELGVAAQPLLGGDQDPRRLADGQAHLLLRPPQRLPEDGDLGVHLLLADAAGGGDRVPEHLGARWHAELNGPPDGVLDVLGVHGDQTRRGHEQLGNITST